MGWPPPLRCVVGMICIQDTEAVCNVDLYDVATTDCWPPDARYSALGQRKLLPRGDDACLPRDDLVTDAAAYQQWRFEHGVAEGSEIPAGAQLPGWAAAALRAQAHRCMQSMKVEIWTCLGSPSRSPHARLCAFLMTMRKRSCSTTLHSTSAGNIKRWVKAYRRPHATCLAADQQLSCSAGAATHEGQRGAVS